MSKNILVFVNGKLLMSNEYTCHMDVLNKPNLLCFKYPLNSQARNTFVNVTIVKNGVKIYEERIEKQNISTLNLYSGEISE